MRSFRIVPALLIVAQVTCQAQSVDDFSGAGWRPFSSTPGAMNAAAGKLQLADAPGDPTWYTVSKTFQVNLDQSPVFLVQVADLTDRGTVKLIRKAPEDKRTAIEIDRPGLYAIDMRERFGWTGTAQVEVCLYAIGSEAEITYEFVKFAPAVTAEERQRIAQREGDARSRLEVARFTLVPSFHACSVYFRSEERPGLALEYRREGGAWQPAFAPVYVREDGMYRGSIVRLAEDTACEVRIRDGAGAVLEQGAFRTWRSEVPVARTVVLDDKNFAGRLTIRDRGSAEGWVRYTAREGFVLRNGRTGPLLELIRANHVILHGLTLRGGLKDAIVVDRCENVRIVNCDIAGWGRVGTQRFDLNGMFYSEDGKAINWDTAIRISRSAGTVVERCYIHDPVSTANSWYYAHPAGPQALGLDRPVSTVVRYNDFIGSDEHRWNDAIEGAGNFDVDGGFNRDADIYGNFHCHANDDAIEIDGGQINVRVYDNQFEGCLCGVSIQGCMAGPSYVFDNLLVNMGDERGVAGQTIKTSSHANGPSAVSYILGNTTFGHSSDLSFVPNLRIVAHNNLFAGRRAISGRSGSPHSVGDFNLLANGGAGEEPHGVVAEPGFFDPGHGRFDLRPDSPAIGKGMPVPNFTSDGPVDLGAIPHGSARELPVRPLPVSVDPPQLVFNVSELQAAPVCSLTVRTSQGFSSPFRVAQNEVFDWFTVTPRSGTLAADREQALAVTLLPDKMRERRHYRGAFLIRLPDGLSRPVTVYAETGWIQPVKPAREGVWVQYQEAEEPGGGKAGEVAADPAASGEKFLRFDPRKGRPAVQYRFAAPRDGVYFVLLRVRAAGPSGSRGSVEFAMDDLPLGRAQLRVEPEWGWCLAAQNREMSLICLQPFKLAAGEHVVKLAPREALDLDLVALTDNPGMFE